MKFSTLAAAGALAGIASAAPNLRPRTTVPAANKVTYKLDMQYFHAAAKAGHTKDNLAAIMALKGRRWFGQATEVYTLNPDPAYAAIAEGWDFDRVTPENSMKWESTEPSQGVFTFQNADALVAWAHANHQAVRGHNLVWHSQLPTFLSQNPSNFTYDALKAILENHVRTVVSHFKGQCDMWDVVNEMFNDDGTFRQSVWYNMFGTDYVRWALTWAHEEDPDALLFINDYNFEYPSAKVTMAAEFFQSLVNEGYPLGAVGLESHLVVGQVVKSNVVAALKTFTDIGLMTYMTELDIRFDLGRGNDIANYTAAQVAQQNLDYYNVISACLGNDNCLGATNWEYTDKYSWIPGVFAGQGAADIWDVRLNPKGAYRAVQDAINGVACSNCAGASVA